jgi:hypothetical protein
MIVLTPRTQPLPFFSLFQFYLALYAPVEESFLFLAALLPSLVALSVMFLVRPVEVVKGRDEGDRRSFLLSYVSSSPTLSPICGE